MECIFCKIVNKELTAQITHEDTEIIAFHDINPKAPIHQLIIPKKHIATINDIEAEDTELLGKMILTAQKLAIDQDIAEHGYRLVFNCNKGAGQEVFHIHLHLLGGRAMHWPPG